jgi:hypothetical protein
MRAVTRQLFATAGSQVLKAAVDRAVVTVDRTANRLDSVAARPPRAAGEREGRKPPERPAASGRATQPASALRAHVGETFSFVVHRAVLLLQLVQRLVRQLLAALARRLGRGDASASDGPDGRTRSDRKAPTSKAGTGRGARPPDGPELVGGTARPSPASRRRSRPETGVAPRRRRTERPGQDGQDD